ncbi:MAG: DUF523 domain-containing protein [Synergistes sp.]|nr:DUF523 domain-containing protein [Synergistes sp.]
MRNNRPYLIVSACLLGINCRYSGEKRADSRVLELIGKYSVMPLCPEQLGGLPTPRNACEIAAGRVIDAKGADFTDNYIKGAQEVLRIARMFNCRFALMKENSPSCGVNSIHDGTFSGGKIAGQGITSRLLREAGIKVFSEEEMELLKEESA